MGMDGEKITPPPVGYTLATQGPNPAPSKGCRLTSWVQARPLQAVEPCVEELAPASLFLWRLNPAAIMLSRRVGSMVREYRSAMWFLFFVGLGGAVIVYLATPVEENPWRQLALHVGVALMVAVLVGIFALMHEFRGIFLRHLEEVLVDQRFINSLSPTTLLEISRKAFHASIFRSVNNTEHQWEKIYQTVSSEILPLAAMEHRESYEEHVTLDFMTLGQVAAELALPAPPANPNIEVCRRTTTTFYRVISPQECEMSTYPVNYEIEVEAIPGLPPERHADVSVQKDNENPTPLVLTATMNARVVKLVGTRNVEYQKSCVIKLSTTEWEHDAWFQLMTMRTFTKDFVTSVTSNKDLDLKWYVFAMGGRTNDPVIKPRSIYLKHTGWLLPNHGAMVYWT